MQIVYCSPSSHTSGHQSSAMAAECYALRDHANILPTVITYSGIKGQTGLRYSAVHPLIRTLTRFVYPSLLRWIAQYLVTLLLAVHTSCSLNYCPIYVRDCDPFIFLPSHLALLCPRTRFICSIIGLELQMRGNTKQRLLSALILPSKRIVYTCQNETVLNYYSKLNIRLLPLGVHTDIG